MVLLEALYNGVYCLGQPLAQDTLALERLNHLGLEAGYVIEELLHPGIVKKVMYLLGLDVQRAANVNPQTPSVTIREALVRIKSVHICFDLTLILRTQMRSDDVREVLLPICVHALEWVTELVFRYDGRGNVKFVVWN